jgi:hypothetical protein
MITNPQCLLLHLSISIRRLLTSPYLSYGHHVCVCVCVCVTSNAACVCLYNYLSFPPSWWTVDLRPPGQCFLRGDRHGDCCSSTCDRFLLTSGPFTAPGHRCTPEGQRDAPLLIEVSSRWPKRCCSATKNMNQAPLYFLCVFVYCACVEMIRAAG